MVLIKSISISFTINAHAIENQIQHSEIETNNRIEIHNQLEQYFTTLNHNLTISVLVKNSNKIPKNCISPLISRSNKNNTWGNITAVINCSGIKTYLPIYVEATGEFIVANRMLLKGETIVPDDLLFVTGRFDKLDFQPEVSIDNLIGAEIIKNIPRNSPINPSFIKKPWAIKAGQNVQVIFVGNGFTAKNTGKALNNGYLGGTVKIRMSGKDILVATVTGIGQATAQ